MTGTCQVRSPAPFPLLSRPCGGPPAAVFTARCGCGHEDEAPVCRRCAEELHALGRFGCSRCDPGQDCGVRAVLRWTTGVETVLQEGASRGTA